ncbi:hypothetical protein LRP52_40395, partial [Photobacterium sp. ZSDE20]|nr:hypothetical protein [Photobacterium sp. ZSDE20]
RARVYGDFANSGDLVCCNLNGNKRMQVPFKEEGDRRSYMCGSWPLIDIVHQPISTSKLGFTRNITEI